MAIQAPEAVAIKVPAAEGIQAAVTRAGAILARKAEDTQVVEESDLHQALLADTREVLPVVVIRRDTNLVRARQQADVMEAPVRRQVELVRPAQSADTALTTQQGVHQPVVPSSEATPANPEMEVRTTPATTTAILG